MAATETEWPAEWAASERPVARRIRMQISRAAESGLRGRGDAAAARASLAAVQRFEMLDGRQVIHMHSRKCQRIRSGCELG